MTAPDTPRHGPLAGLTVVELAGLGPAPFCGMMLADLGARVIRVDRPGHVNPGNPLKPRSDLLNRGRSSIAVDLKTPEGIEVVLRLIERADAFIEGFRPGVTERLGVGPEVCLARNPKLVYGRMTGWGQDGPYATRAGHDINYISIAGALYPMGAAGCPPSIPLNLVGDFGGGGMLLAFGIMAALWESSLSGAGQVVDAAIVDGAAVMMTMFHAMRAEGVWNDDRGTNLLDGGAHFYNVYACSDEKFLSVGAIEPQFYAQLLAGLGLEADRDLIDGHADRSSWDRLTRRLASIFKTRSRDQWLRIFEGTDACVAAVLSLHEVALDPHNQAREGFVDGRAPTQPAPAPRFSRSGRGSLRQPPLPGEHTISCLTEAGFATREVEALLTRGVVTQSAADEATGSRLTPDD